MKTVLDVAEEIANNGFDGHLTMFKFTTGWKVVFRTPGELIYPSKERALLARLPEYMTLDEALSYAVRNKPAFKD